MPNIGVCLILLIYAIIIYSPSVKCPISPLRTDLVRVKKPEQKVREKVLAKYSLKICRYVSCAGKVLSLGAILKC